MKLMYLFDQLGRYIGKNHFNPGDIFPLNSTEIPPNETSAGTIPVWTGKDWVSKAIADFEAHNQQSLIISLKSQRDSLVQSIIVTTQSGKSFDGNEDAQNRMARAITALNPTEESLWVLADNTPTMVSREELQEALRLAGAAQTAIWVAPYQ